MRLHGVLQRFGLAQNQGGEHGKQHTEDNQQTGQPPIERERQRYQDDQRHECGEMLAEKAEPETPERIGALQHDFHQPAGMHFAVIGEGQLQHVLEVAGQDRQAPPVRQPIGKKRDRRRAENREEAKAHPGKKQQP